MQLSDEILVILSLKCGLPASVLIPVFELLEEITSTEMVTRDEGRANIRGLIPCEYRIWPGSGTGNYSGRTYRDSQIVYNDTLVKLSDILAMVETQCS